ncbi:MAG: DEAD/DEAH box helicase, partial [Alphaproteobacteria bacterium]|nr:DEAD/DEAH box helicase [Alphaproteobacteria bacterium]
ELAAQVSENFEIYGKYHKLNMALLIGGVSFEDQSRIIDRGADVLVATPGRLLDHFERGGLLLRGVDILVIDEADRMLDMGFIPDVERIVQLCNPNRQTLFFSATMPPEIRRLADLFLNDPTEIAVAPPASPAETVDQTLSLVTSDNKREALRVLLRDQPVKNALVFCNRKRDVDIVAKSLISHGFNASALHGDMNQSYRMQTLEKFRQGEIAILVCSDVAARGLDIQGLSHVFLFDVPMHAEDYVHRIGRTGRAGMPGRSLTLATPEDGKYVAAVEKLIGKDIPRFEVEGLGAGGFDEDDGRRRRGRGGRGRRSQGERPAEKDGEGKTGGAGRRRGGRDKTEAAEPKKERESRDSERPRKRGRGKGGGERKSEGGRDKPVVGMGDHVPAFMTRSSGRPKKKS